MSKMIQHFSKPYGPLGRDINVKVHLFNYATKADLKNSTGVDTSQLTSKSDFASSKAELHKIDVNKLKPFPNDLSKLNNVVSIEVVKKLCIIY